MMKEKKADLNYSTYLKLEELLSLQEPRSRGQHDEMLFIVIHQAYELWFKLMIFELNSVVKSLIDMLEYQVLGTLKRIRHIIKLIVKQMDILETMHPTSFQAFREFLGTASGFQSSQFREIESLLGIVKSNPIKSNDKQITLRSSIFKYCHVFIHKNMGNKELLRILKKLL